MSLVCPLFLSFIKSLGPSFFSLSSTSNPLLAFSSNLTAVMLHPSFRGFPHLYSLLHSISGHFSKFLTHQLFLLWEDYHLPSGPSSHSPQWMTMSWPPRLLCFTRQLRPAASPAATSRVTRRYQVPSALGRTSPRRDPGCFCLPLIHITHTGFGWKPETWHTNNRRPGPGLGPLDTQACGFTREERGEIEFRRAP